MKEVREMRDPQYSYDSYKRSGEPRAYSTNMQVGGVPYPPPRSGKTSVSKNYYYEDSSSSSWGFSDPEIKRRKRITLYKAYGVEGKMKASLRGGFRWVKNGARRFFFFFFFFKLGKIKEFAFG